MLNVNSHKRSGGLPAHRESAFLMKKDYRDDSQKIRIGIVEDHPLFRQGLLKALSFEDDLIVVGEAGTGKAALQMVTDKNPDVVLLDVNLPDTNGLQVSRKIKAGHRNVRVVMLTAYHEKEQVLYVMRSGASAYCPKQISPDDLVQIIHDVAAGFYVIDGQKLTSDELKQWIRETIESIIGPYVKEPEQHFVPLSPRETEILYSVTHGMSNKEIALELGISQQTVKNHMTSILQKLNVKDRTQAAVTAIRHGWVRLYDFDSKDNEQG
jgi:DNA-binding NarL/FixJ family response regulator